MLILGEKKRKKKEGECLDMFVFQSKIGFWGGGEAAAAIDDSLCCVDYVGSHLGKLELVPINVVPMNDLFRIPVLNLKYENNVPSQELI